jgi:hypothetical protein
LTNPDGLTASLRKAILADSNRMSAVVYWEVVLKSMKVALDVLNSQTDAPIAGAPAKAARGPTITTTSNYGQFVRDQHVAAETTTGDNGDFVLEADASIQTLPVLAVGFVRYSRRACCPNRLYFAAL